MVSVKQFSTVLALAAVSSASNAPVSTDSADGNKYVATFKPTSKSNITGTVEFQPASNGSVTVNVDLSGFPSTGGPFPYHIHQAPVPTDGNCTGTLLHLNPFNGTVNATSAAGKEVGDLAGKHGNLPGGSVSISYVDNYISLNPDNKAYLGGLSVVVHALDNTRLSCANITEESVSSNSTSNATTNSTGGSSHENFAGKNNVAIGVLAGAAAVAVGLLI
ncbi:Cu/Zn superoxide dismutase [Scheffersomyces xylosifermentans]|uniref:Cu/Zn superoxide dismutase n=1 Tax=Scheffersomyces xylosifermentans TaxID=1304137 RepID=UPI00315CF4E4